MAGKMRFAAIFVTLTSMLAGGGGAAYYILQGKLPFGIGAGADASLTAEDGFADSARPHAAAADLDAVEDAWAEAGSTSADPSGAIRDTNEPTSEVRSGDVTQARADRLNDRYAMQPDARYSADPSADSQPTEITTPPSNDRYGSMAVEKAQSSAMTEDSETLLPPITPESDTPSIARGQEPNADASIESISAEADANPAAAALRSAANESASGAAASSQRAREAFRDTPAEASAARYGSAAGSSRALSVSRQQEAASINPFAAEPTRDASAAPEVAPIEVIEPMPADAGPSPPNGSINEEFERAEPMPIPSVPNSHSEHNGYSGLTPSYGSGSNASASAPEPNSLGGDIASGEGTGRPGERVLEGPQKPALVIQKIAPPEIQVGKAAKFLVKVQNIGVQSASDVVIHDEVPQGTRLVGTSPTAEVAGSQLTWHIGKLSTGEERTVEIDLQPTTEGEVGSVATVSYSAQASVKTRCTMPQLAIRMTAADEVMIGQEQRVKIELHNPGSGDATGVMLFENVPENVRHEAGAALEFEIGTLKAGETRELELALVAEKAGKVVNVLSARADGNLQVQQQVEFEVIAPALAVAVDGPGRRYLERAATYQVIIENPGTAPARDVELVTKLPKGLRFVSANNMGEYDASSHAVYWSLAELPEGERGTVELVAMPIETGTQTLEVEGRAQQGLADQTEQQIMIEGIASIMFEVRDAEDPIEVGGETSYEIRVANEGTKAASNVRVVMSLTPGMKLVSAEGDTPHMQQGASIIFEPIAQIAPKSDTLFRVKVKGTQPGDQRIKVEVSTDDLSQPIRREESTRVFGDE